MIDPNVGAAIPGNYFAENYRDSTPQSNAQLHGVGAFNPVRARNSVAVTNNGKTTAILPFKSKQMERLR